VGFSGAHMGEAHPARGGEPALVSWSASRRHLRGWRQRGEQETLYERARERDALQGGSDAP